MNHPWHLPKAPNKTSPPLPPLPKINQPSPPHHPPPPPPPLRSIATGSRRAMLPPGCNCKPHQNGLICPAN
ncbi:MAG: hypothetical protein D8M54_12415 [Chloroflexi bacterium]|nr:hypothetical protein [Chloroflexota bacterium]